MSCLSLRKKLQPATKAWKGFTSSLQTKLQKLKRSKPIKTTSKHLNTLYSFLTRKHYPPLHLGPHKPTAPKPSPTSPSNNPNLHRSFPPIYVDELFSEPVSMPVKLMEPKTRKGKGAPSVRTDPLSLWGVDERAEKFISMFHEEMRIQRERSLGEYHEMLARGVM